MKVSNIEKEMNIFSEIKRERAPTPAHDEDALIEIMSKITVGDAFDDATAPPVDISGCCINADDLRILNFLFEGLSHYFPGILKGEKNMAPGRSHGCKSTIPLCGFLTVVGRPPHPSQRSARSPRRSSW